MKKFPSKSSTHLISHITITVLLTTSPMLHLTSSWLFGINFSLSKRCRVWSVPLFKWDVLKIEFLTVLQSEVGSTSCINLSWPVPFLTQVLACSRSSWISFTVWCPCVNVTRLAYTILFIYCYWTAAKYLDFLTIEWWGYKNDWELCQLSSSSIKVRFIERTVTLFKCTIWWVLTNV